MRTALPIILWVDLLFQIETIKKLIGDVQPESICLVARTNRQLHEDYIPALLNAKIDYLLLNPDTPDDAGRGVRLATMHRVKGLEYHHIIIAGANAGTIPLEYQNQFSQPNEYDSSIKERCLFHVACTRARDTLTVTSYGIASEFLN